MNEKKEEHTFYLRIGHGVYKGKPFDVYHEHSDFVELYVDFGEKRYSLLELLEAKEQTSFPIPEFRLQLSEEGSLPLIIDAMRSLNELISLWNRVTDLVNWLIYLNSLNHLYTKEEEAEEND